MKKIIISSICASVLGLSLSSAEITSPVKEAALDYVIASEQVDVLFNSFIEGQTALYKKHLSLSAEHEAKLAELQKAWIDGLPKDRLVDTFADMYAITFSEAELKELLSFSDSKVGKKLISFEKTESSKLVTEFSAFLSANEGSFASDINSFLEEVHKSEIAHNSKGEHLESEVGSEVEPQKDAKVSSEIKSDKDCSDCTSCDVEPSVKEDTTHKNCTSCVEEALVVPDENSKPKLEKATSE